jgi:hypothetical protein
VPCPVSHVEVVSVPSQCTKRIRNDSASTARLADAKATHLWPRPAPRHVHYEQRSRGVGRPEAVASDDEQVQVPAYGRQCLGADAAQVTSGSLIGDGTDLLGHGERDLPQPGVLIRGNPYVMVKSAIATGERHREEQSGDHGVPVV